MKMPDRPPRDWLESLRETLALSPVSVPLEKSFADALAAAGSVDPYSYPHWDQLRFHKPPESWTHRQWWALLKFQRQFSKRVPLSDASGRVFVYNLPDPITELLHRIDQRGGGSIELPEPVVNPSTRDRYVVSSLIEEAIRSSQLEGAVTTRKIAKDMIREGRRPRDRSERMILNNFLAMQRIRELKDQRLAPDTILDLQRILTADTLEDPSAAGRFRQKDERIDVVDQYDEVFHTPPPADQLEARIAAMCDFANGQTPGQFIHPVVRAIILHFWLAYDHPFVDGNGRCARAVFYWLMLKNRYWLAEYISISEVIYRAPAQYYRAFLYTETDDNDLTYFILHHLGVVEKAFEELLAYVSRKSEQLREVERRLRLTAALNHRQRALLSHAIRHPDARYTFESHQRSHDVVYETARSDLLDLQAKGLLIGAKIGRTWHFSPVPDLERKLGDVGA